jgi:ornithine cyclodeaminase/alanine dehydrogenase-like protein (mu-crystallin family)
LYISESEVRAALTYEALIPAIRQALKDYSAGLIVQPSRSISRAGNAEGNDNGWFAVMPVIAGDFMAVKTVTFFPGNAKLNLPTHQAVIALLSRSTGEPLAMMDGRLITEMRTAAVSAVAFAVIAQLHFVEEPTSFGVLGSGVQARSHIQAFRHVLPALKDIRIWSRTPANAERLAEEAGARVVPIEEAASADVVLTAVAVNEPVLMGSWLKPNALVISIGAVGGTLRELDDEVMQTSYIIAESRAGVERESGDLLLSGAKIAGEIGELLAGSGTAQIPRDRRVLFKSLGMGIEDLTAAGLVWQARTSRSK